MQGGDYASARGGKTTTRLLPVSATATPPPGNLQHPTRAGTHHCAIVTDPER
eukprot:COSAG02_NODE_150_length_33596_cov_61.953966_8_plen_52_part_00